MKEKDFICKCGRQQSYAPQNKSGGITEKEAEIVGWRKIDGQWSCPFCNNLLGNLFKIFDKGTE